MSELEDSVRASQLRNILGWVPAYLANDFIEPRGSPQLRVEQRGLKQSELYISGHSTWRTTNKYCDLKNKIIPYQLLLGIQRSTLCSFVNDSRLTNWPGLYGEGIASDAAAHSVEQEGRIFYLAAEANWMYKRAEKSPDEFHIDLGNVDENTARWWVAILAPGEVFSIRRSGHHETSCRGPFIPPSSESALGYLADFVMRHYVDNQCSVALAAALTFPFLCGVRGAKLPLPNILSKSTGPPDAEGYTRIPIYQPDERILKDEMLSENATRSIYGWLRNSGWPKGEKEIYCHSWIGFSESDEEIDDTRGGDGDIENNVQPVRVWSNGAIHDRLVF
ncbi:hypothetical protein BKA61DRAFT_635617 [Leptodontidium sp. MPI-SDFR-AT-0119]|nr:hypothetical protein BKA61DRAFT_635617 [Leptodontidium sp. MPI-SDFR-AT-0119]